jgi:exopolysaccharide biosynthesis polyprenyl glycosylphosphotransferase
MAVASQTIPGALKTGALTDVSTRAATRERVAPRWVASACIGAGDLLALGVSVALIGNTGALVLAYVPAVILCLAVSGGLRNRMSLRALDQLPWIAGRLAVPLLALAPIALLVTSEITDLLSVALVAVGLISITRVASYAALRIARRRGHLLEPAVILGAGEVGAELARAFRDFPEYGVVPVGFLDCVAGNLPYPVLGDMDQLDTLLTEHDVRRVIVAFGPAREAELVGVLRVAVTHDTDVHIVPRFFDVGVTPTGPDTDDVRGIPLYRVHRAALRARAWYAKRVVDVVVAGGVLVVMSPVLALVAIAVKLSSPGPVFFRQERIGQDGREIQVPKFRTLRVNFDSDTQWNVAEDPRLTGIGRLIRRTSIDELPQLWSVLRGDMSLVGPRPERPFFVRRFTADIDGYGDRHRLPVGLTGWAQVHGLRGDTSIEERARFDNQYIEHWSLWRDFVILLRTVAEVVRGRGR